MGIMDEDVARVRETADIVAIVSQHTQLRKVGRNWSGLCPFHNEKSPSFSVNAEEGLYYCFGCGAKGDTINFVREIDHLDFVGAVESLATRSGIQLRYTDQHEGEGRKKTARLHTLMGRAVDWYHDRLLTGADAGVARKYLRSRGFDREMVDTYKIGWAPDSWDAMVKSLGAPIEDLTDCGLGFVNKAGRRQDFFRSRILFPIFDERDRPVAFGGRKLPDTEGPKYQNSRENYLYNKSATLYGLNWAKTDVVQANEIIICEGYTDVIGFFRADIPRAVATCGTALTEDHLKVLKRYTKRIVLAYDGDEAGQNASERVYEWEQKHEVEFSVLNLPKGSDPDELSRTDPEALAAAVSTSKPILQFRLDRVLLAADLSVPERRANAAMEAVDVLRSHPSDLVREQYLMMISDTCRIPSETLRAELAKPAKPKQDKRKARSSSGPNDGDPGPGGAFASAPVNNSNATNSAKPGQNSPGRAPMEGAEVEALKLVIADRAIADRFCSALFSRGVTRDAFDVLRGSDSLAEALEACDPALAEYLNRLAFSESWAELDDVFLLLARNAGTRAMASYAQRARVSEDPLSFSTILSWLKLRLDEISGDKPRMDLANELVDWLNENSEDFS